MKTHINYTHWFNLSFFEGSAGGVGAAAGQGATGNLTASRTSAQTDLVALIINAGGDCNLCGDQCAPALIGDRAGFGLGIG